MRIRTTRAPTAGTALVSCALPRQPGQCDQLFEPRTLGCRRLAHEAALVREVDVGLAFDTREVEARMVLVATDAEATAAPVGVDDRVDRGVEVVRADVADEHRARLVRSVVRARQEQRLDLLAAGGARPELAARGGVVEPLARGAQGNEQV